MNGRSERVGHPNAEAGLAIAAVIDPDVANFAIRRPVIIQLIGHLHVIFLRVGFIVVAADPFRAAGIDIVQLCTPVAEDKSGPRVAAVNFVIIFAGVVRVAGVLIAIASGDIEAVVETVLRVQVRLVDGAAVVALNGKSGVRNRFDVAFQRQLMVSSWPLPTTSE